MDSDLFHGLAGGGPAADGGASPGPGRRASDEVTVLRDEIERLLIVTEALWTILKEKHGLDDEELVRQMVGIDLRDGRLDGRLATEPPQPCPKCGRTLAKRRVRCLYCGELVAPSPFAR